MSATRGAILAIVGFALFSASIGNAQSKAVATNASTLIVATNAPVSPSDLPKGACDVVKLFQTGKKDNVLVFYVKYSGLDYHLGVNDVIYLKAVGVSSDVINAMLEVDKDRQKALAVRSDDDRYFGRTAGSSEPVAAPASVQGASPVVQSEPEPIRSVIYPDYSAYPNYYQTFDNSDSHHVSIGIGIGVGAAFGFGDTGFHHGYYGHRHYR